jgi:hypothetical protein
LPKSAIYGIGGSFRNIGCSVVNFLGFWPDYLKKYPVKSCNIRSTVDFDWPSYIDVKAR